MYWQLSLKHEEEMKKNPLEKHLVPLAIHTHNYRVKQVMTYNLIRPLFREIAGQVAVGNKAETELWVQSEDGRIGGKIDLIKHTEEGIHIIDYKTGMITDSSSAGNTIKDGYKNQLMMYAALYYSSQGIWPIKLVLIGLDQYQYEIPVDKNECQTVIKSAIDFLDELNVRINAGMSADTFAEPSPENCRFCSYRPTCKKYWAQREEQSDWPTDIKGLMRGKKLLGNGSMKIELESKNECVSIRGLTPERYIFLNSACNEVMFCNLGKDITKGYYREIPMTTGYGLL
jgi:CRISPR/Cas system-associated exonuclease Cas4 (RecB family)